MSSEKAQGLVEFAVIFPLFVTLLFAIVDGGLLMGRYGSINNAAREGARRGAVGANRDQISAVVRDQAHGIMPTATTIDGVAPNTTTVGCGAFYNGAENAVCIEWIDGPGGEAPGDFGSAVRVKVKYRYPILTPLFGLFGVADPAWHVESCGLARLEQLITGAQRADPTFDFAVGAGDSCA